MKHVATLIQNHAKLGVRILISKVEELTNFGLEVRDILRYVLALAISEDILIDDRLGALNRDRKKAQQARRRSTDAATANPGMADLAELLVHEATARRRPGSIQEDAAETAVAAARRRIVKKKVGGPSSSGGSATVPGGSAAPSSELHQSEWDDEESGDRADESGTDSGFSSADGRAVRDFRVAAVADAGDGIDDANDGQDDRCGAPTGAGADSSSPDQV